MNVLQVIPVFNPPELYGGSQQMVYQISKELVKRGHNVSVYTSDAKRSSLKERVTEATERVDGIHVFRFRNISPTLAELGFVITPEMNTSLRRENFDLIHLHEGRSYQHIAVWQFARKSKIPYVLQAHGVLGEHSFSRSIFDFALGRRILKGASANIALNQHEAEQYRALGVQSKKTIVIPNGIDLMEYSDLPPKGSFKKKLCIREEEKVVLYLGRIHKIKGIDVLIRAFARIFQMFDDVKLVIAGPDDGFLGELRGLIAASGIENNVLLLGPLYGTHKLEAYVDADVCVLPSRYETFPISLLEAYACGKPVVASSCEGVKELVPNQETGILVKPGDASELSEALAFVLSERVEGMCSKARKYVKQFDIQGTIDKLERLYCNVISKELQ